MVDSPVESFKTHSNYIRAFATLVGADSQKSPSLIYPELANKVVQSGCLANPPKATIDDRQVVSSLRNAWGTELLINIGRHFVDEPELVKLSNNWSTVQAYYVLYHSTQAVAVAKGNVRPKTHPTTQRMFYNLWAARDLCLEPWTLSYGSEGTRNIPSHIIIDDTIHNWSHCSSDTAWSLACKALKTTREDKLAESVKKAREKKKAQRISNLKKEEAERIMLGKRPKKTPNVRVPHLTTEEKLSVDKKESPTTIIDYLYRLRIKTNYVDPSIFTDGCESDSAAIQVRDDLSIIAGGNLLLSEITVSNIVGHDVFLQWINDWVRTNVPDHTASGIRDRLQIHNQM